MRAIKLHFPEQTHLTALLNDRQFLLDINYLNPYSLDSNNLVLFDPVTQHNPLDTEIVILSKFARAIKNIIFPNSQHNVEFLNPFLGQQKGGLIHDSLRVIDSTDIERLSINITVNQI